jgi:voltage-dependent anion channel protein 2
MHKVCTIDLLDYVMQGPSITADAVVGRDGFLLGGEATYNVNDGRVTRYAAAVGYAAPEYAVTLHGLGNMNLFAASYYHRVNRDVEAGAKAVYDGKATVGNVSLEVGAKAYLDQAAFVKAKVNSAGLVFLGSFILHRWERMLLNFTCRAGYTQALR